MGDTLNPLSPIPQPTKQITNKTQEASYLRFKSRPWAFAILTPSATWSSEAEGTQKWGHGKPNAKSQVCPNPTCARSPHPQAPMAKLSDFLAGSWKWGVGGDAGAGMEKSCGEAKLKMAVEGSWPLCAFLWGQLRTQSPRHSFSHKVSKSPRSQAQLAGFTARPTEEARGGTPGKVYWKLSVPQDSRLPGRCLCAPVVKGTSFSEQISEVLSA